MNPLALAPLEDVQSQCDDRGIEIDEVGICDLRMPVQVLARGAVPRSRQSPPSRWQSLCRMTSRART